MVKYGESKNDFLLCKDGTRPWRDILRGHGVSDARFDARIPEGSYLEPSVIKLRHPGGGGRNNRERSTRLAAAGRGGAELSSVARVTFPS